VKIKIDTTGNNKPKDERLAKLQRKFDLALSMKAPSAEIAFSEAYEIIEIAIAKGLSQKEVITQVNETYDLKLHAASFRKLLNDERRARDAGGQPALCPTCCHPLATDPHAKPGEPTNNADADTTAHDKEDA
jgi:hypothetical protein